MLQIKGVSKVYRTGSLTQQALDHVSLSLRDSEFVAILGQSGSGKTTLLNIIGGLDRYDEGDLVINGVSTKEYTDRDWDAYRNHTVGFVFQSYNLIPHQTILANVELALTIGGVSKKERSRRAAEALEKVGLGAHLHKRPSQLSGGQMQRVAIARALVNDPDILLADEPTGALDSDTSIQVMDLLREVARDRLVVMVTHNPELAERYATRIVNLRDGVILSDSNPFSPEEAAPPEHRRLGKASMSFLTALALSFNNLRTKKARTILVAFAGSIGIIGIAMILSLSNGVDAYIQNVEEETLQGYPLQITDTSFDLSTLMTARQDSRTAEEDADADVRELKTVTNMFSRVTTNDLTALKAYLDSGDSGVGDHVRAIEYDYGLSPQLYALREGTVRQVNPDRSFAALGFSATDSMSGMLSSMYSTDTFHAMPENEDLFRNEYDVKAGRWPEGYNECVLVLTEQGRVTDLTLYTLGLKDPRTLDEMIRIFTEGGEPQADGAEAEYRYEDFLGISFRLVNSADYYAYDEDYGVWTDKSGDEAYLRQLVEDGEPVTLVGVVQPREGAASPVLSFGLGYPASLIGHAMETAMESPIVQAQLADPETDVFSGTAFGAEQDGDLDMSKLFSVDQEAVEDAFSFDPAEDWDFSDMDLSDMDFDHLDLTGAVDMDSLSFSMPSFSQQDMAELLSGVKINISADGMETLFRSLLEGYLSYAAQDPSTDYARLSESLRDYLGSEEAQAVVRETLSAALSQAAENAVTVERLQNLAEAVMAGYPAYLESVNGELTPTENEDGEIVPPEITYALVGPYLATPEAQAVLAEQTEALRAQLSGATLGPEALEALTARLAEGYRNYAGENQMPDLSLLRDSFSDYLSSAEAQAILAAGVSQAVDASGLEQRAAAMLTSYSSAVGYQLSAMMEQVITGLTEAVTDSVTRSMEDFSAKLTDSFAGAFQMDPDALAEAFSMNFTGEELQELMASLLSTAQSSYAGNLKKLGYAHRDDPVSITIYPTDFAGKTEVKNILNRYNDMRLAAGEDDKVITYTDMVDTLMSSVTDIVDAISYVLIAFVAISLVVSSIMIGVITYISVLERNKEIGILRAIGASKGNISQVFNAETFIIGALAGLLGVGITWLLLFPANHIIRSLTDQNIRAALPLGAAAVLVLLSIVLTLIGGIIPSRKAARSDPVAALRSE